MRLLPHQHIAVFMLTVYCFPRRSLATWYRFHATSSTLTSCRFEKNRFSRKAGRAFRTSSPPLITPLSTPSRNGWTEITLAHEINYRHALPTASQHQPPPQTKKSFKRRKPPRSPDPMQRRTFVRRGKWRRSPYSPRCDNVFSNKTDVAIYKICAVSVLEGTTTYGSRGRNAHSNVWSIIYMLRRCYYGSRCTVRTY